MTAIARPVPLAADAAPAELSRRRRIAVWTLVVAAAVIGFVSILTTWVDRQMLDNKAFSKASADLIQDPAVRSSVATYLVNQVYENVDVAAALEQRLPSNLDQLAAPLATALQQPLTSAATRLLGRPRVQALWIRTTSGAHERLVNVLENKTGHGITTGNGVVTLDLHA